MRMRSSSILVALISIFPASSYAGDVSAECSSQVELKALKDLKSISVLIEEFSTEATVARNVELVQNAKWSFGRSQKGFEIYIPLIQSTIGTSAHYDTVAFANALKAWQKKQGYDLPNGVLDLSAFYFLKDYWQAERNMKGAFKERRMVQISAADRYDPNRENSLSMIGEKTYAAYQEMLAAARKDGLGEKDLKIVASNRTPARLKMLQQNSSWKSVGFTVAGKTSVHFSGRALDLYVGGEPVSSSDKNRRTQIKTKAYQWLVKNGTKFGFRNYFFEPWHWEYVGNDT